MNRQSPLPVAPIRVPVSPAKVSEILAGIDFPLIAADVIAR
jgi:hypothetical protein